MAIAIKMLIAGAIVPAVLSSVVLILLCRGWRRSLSGPAAIIGAASALPLGYMLSHLMISNWPSFPIVDSTHWLPYIGIGAAALSVAELTWARFTWLKWAVRVAAAGVTTFLLMRSMLVFGWGGSARAMWPLVIVAGVLIIWWILERDIQSSTGTAVWLMLLLIAGSLAIAIGFAGSARVGQYAGASAAALVPYLLLGWKNSSRRVLSASVAPIVLLYSGLLMCGYFFVRMPAITTLLFLIAPFAYSVTSLAFMRATQSAGRLVPRLASLLIPAAIAGVIVAIGITIVVIQSPPLEY